MAASAIAGKIVEPSGQNHGGGAAREADRMVLGQLAGELHRQHMTDLESVSLADVERHHAVLADLGHAAVDGDDAARHRPVEIPGTPRLVEDRGLLEDAPRHR